jgi:hypothetical protein
MSENVGASTSHNPKGLHGLYRDSFTFTFTDTQLLCNCFKTPLGNSRKDVELFEIRSEDYQ